MDLSQVEFTAEFVPLSVSRNAGGEHPTINWRVTLRNNGYSLTTDYSEGIGHLPFSVGGRRTVSQQQQIDEAVETGKWRLDPNRLARPYHYLKPPALEDVLCSLSMDAEAIEHPTYECWATDMGFDEDSRKGERVYRACLEIGLTLRHMFDLDELRDHFKDY